MSYKVLSAELSIAPQIGLTDLPGIAKAGFKSVICNRPDGESPGQPTFEQIQDAAKPWGLACYFLPAESGKVSAENGAAFAQLMANVPKPVVAYCRSGLRSSTMWAIANEQRVADDA